MQEDKTPPEDAPNPEDYNPPKRVKDALVAALAKQYLDGYGHGFLHGTIVGAMVVATLATMVFIRRG